MKRKTRTVMPRRTTPKLRKPAISESEADTNEPSSALSPPPTSRKASATKPRSAVLADDAAKNSPADTNGRSSLGRDPLTATVPATVRAARVAAQKSGPDGLGGTRMDERTDDIPVSSMVESRKGRLPADTPTACRTTTGSGGTGASGNKLIDELKAKFDQLSMLRTTAAESLLEEYKTSAERRISAAEGMIEALRRENELLRQQQQHQSQEHAPGPVGRPVLTGRSSDVSISSRPDDPNRSLLELYRNLSGLQVVPDDEHSQCWHCSLGGRLGEFTFDLRCDQEGSQYEYRPTFGLHSSMASRLPAYLREEIAFDADQLQLFFWRALNFLMTVPAK